MKSNKGGHGFPFRDRGEGKHPIKAGRSGQDTALNCGNDGYIKGKPSQKQGTKKSETIKIQNDGVVVGSIAKPKPSSAKSVNKLPSGGSTRIT